MKLKPDLSHTVSRLLGIFKKTGLIMKICYLGTGSWGFCLALLLATKGYKVTSWTTKPELAAQLKMKGEHPLFPGVRCHPNMSFTTDMAEALEDADLIVESVTAAGLRFVCNQIKSIKIPECPLVVTSKGIEQNSGLILPEVPIGVFGEHYRGMACALSGPSYAQEVIKGLPTSVVGTAFDYDVMKLVCETFTTKTFRVYPNTDIRGVAFGGALKNIIAIACGIADGLQFGFSARAALMTRGLHEIRKLAVACGCKADTIYGLSGMGDVCLTCSSAMSRNFHFGQFLAQGNPAQEALKQIEMVVEGAYTCVTALQLGLENHIAMPISEMVYKIIYENMKATDAVMHLMQRTIKEEHL